ncbi:MULTISPECIES: hypothetical protein [Pseudomonas]|uniref:hypothetical protein n=1 Tax=Pseudomonas TaxID=286 RepID=UPI00128EE0D9|nr:MULTISPECIES: hypothetical protein [Pseudomonas]MDS9589344.1 hypothetical protein [Pseudomonas sp. HTZ1]QKK97086.1 hypothetical protein GEV38_14460 [Pseudomonas sp. 13159349]
MTMAMTGLCFSIHDTQAIKPISRSLFVGAALCCEEAGTTNITVMAFTASSQHKAAPTKKAAVSLENMDNNKKCLP